jgi:two-component system phosphate regulon sensor histidine kinase PhoR
MEKKIKALYILSIVAILAFLWMQVYWLYNRYAYSLTEYENIIDGKISDAIVEYNKVRTNHPLSPNEETKIQASYGMNEYVDAEGNRRREVSVSIEKLTPDETNKHDKKNIAPRGFADANTATFDASNAPSAGAAWNAMRNFENEMRSPFTVNGIDSILRRDNLNSEVSLVLQDSMIWSPVTVRHPSVFSPSFKIIIPYSELERKAVVIQCEVPTSEILHKMGWTLVMAIVLSLFLIMCLVWQIKIIAKLTRLDKIRNSFITTMIHELKRPISTLKMCISGIDNDKLMEDAQLRHELTGETRIALDNLSAYFSKLRDITFNNVEQIPLNISIFNLRELVNSVVKAIAIPSAKHVEFVNDISDNLDMSADSTHLTNIITNLIENAIKYSGEEVSVKISAEQTTDYIAISIADTGYGISSADKTKIFNRFYRGKASATDIPGMGLGLAYVKLLVDAHGGDISVKSYEGIGSTFTIKLPQ